MAGALNRPGVRGHNEGHIWLNVSSSNCSAIHVYKKAGFRVLNSLNADLEMEVGL